MAFNHFNDNHHDFLEQLCLQKSSLSKLAALVIRANIKNGDVDRIDEIVQVIKFQFIKRDAWLYLNPSKKRIFLVIGHTKTSALTFLEMAIRKEFSEEDLQIEFSSPLEKGINKLCNLLKEGMPPNDNHGILALKRLSRSTNTFLVHSVDSSFREALAKNLQCFGNVITVASISDFFSFYNEYAPNAVFVDTLNYSESTELFIQKIKNDHDKHCKLVVIRKNLEEKQALSLQKAKISNILIWPVTFQSVSSQLQRLRIITS